MSDSTNRLAHLAAPRGNYPHFRRGGDFIYVSGLSARRADNSFPGALPDTSGTIRLDIREQTRAVIEKLAAVLEAAGASLADVVEISTFLVDMNDFGGDDFPEMPSEPAIDVEAERREAYAEGHAAATVELTEKYEREVRTLAEVHARELEELKLRYEVEDGVLTVTLDRPATLNALTRTMLCELLEAFERADADDAIRVVIVTGAGRAFCAGADLSAGARTFDVAARTPRGAAREDGPAAEPHRDGGGLFTLRVFDMKKPVIAAINGPAVGFGATMTLPMDIRIASTAARIGFVFSRRGVVPEAGSTWFLPRIVGINQAAEWVYSGRVFPATEALAGGLVSRVVEPDRLLPTARTLAREIADKTSAVSVALARRMMWTLLGADHPMAGHRLDSRGMEYMGRSADAREGVTSFLEKRPPRFTMRPSKDMPPFYPFGDAPPFTP